MWLRTEVPLRLMRRGALMAGILGVAALVSGFIFTEDRPIRGVTLGLFDLAIEPAAVEREIEAIQQQGANSLSIPVLWFQQDASSTRIGPATENDFDLEHYDALISHAIAAAHARHMSVLLMPIVRLRAPGPGQWRGNLQPPNWGAWFSSYGAFVGHYASLAQRQSVEWLAVGSELSSTEQQTQHWLDLIRRVRAQYDGRLIYSANWDHYETAAFWHELDALGVSGYYALTNEVPATYASILRGWRLRRAQLERWQRGWNLPLILTEVGYPSLPTAARAPWDYTTTGRVDPAMQRLCYRAFIETWQDAPALAGAYLWIWVPGEAGPRDRGYAWRGKPVETELTTWLRDI